MSDAQKYSITRTRATWKPRVDARDLPSSLTRTATFS